MSSYNSKHCFCQDLSNQDCYEIYYKAIEHEHYEALRMKIAPYPTFEIDLSSGYWEFNPPESDKMVETRYSSETKLKADTYLSCLNALVKKYEPKERDIFFSPYHDDHIDNDTFADVCVSILSKILDSYPNLNTIIYSAQHMIINLNIRDLRFVCWLFSEAKTTSINNLRELILIAFRLPRKHFETDWERYGFKPRTENSHLGKCECRLYHDFSDEENGLKKCFKSMKIDPTGKNDWSMRKDVNAVYLLPKLFDKKNVSSPVLFLAPFIPFGKISDTIQYLFKMRLKTRTWLINKFRMKLNTIGVCFASDLLQDDKLMLVINPDASDKHQEFKEIYSAGVTANAVGSDCLELGSMSPFLGHKMITEHIGGGLSTTNVLQVAIRAVYQYNKRNLNSLCLTPLYITENDYYSFLSTTNDRYPHKLGGFPENFSIKFDTPLGIYLPDDAFGHTVCAKLVFLKKIHHNWEKPSYICEVTVYDSFVRPGYGKNVESHVIEVDRKDEQNTYKKYDRKKKKTMYQNIIKKCIIPGLFERVTNEEGNKCDINIRSLQQRNHYVYTNSILFQNNDDDHTCGINSFLCLLMLMKGEDPTDGLTGIKKSFKTVAEYHMNMASLIYSIVIKYITDHKFTHCEGGSEEDARLISEFDGNKSYFDQISTEMTKRGTDYSVVLGKGLSELLSFLPEKTIKGNGSNNGKNITNLFAQFPCISSYNRVYYALNPNEN